MRILIPFTGYGLTEATILACSKPFPGVLGGRAKFVAGSAGILLPGIEARILREDGSDADLNEAGDLWLKAENVALGYWNDERATRETFVDGWLKTGDRFLVDADGYF
jgi:long-subunit acyl-CoA synthetase (AMP-forming)